MMTTKPVTKYKRDQGIKWHYVMQVVIGALFFALMGSIPATVSASETYEYFVKDYKYEYDLRPLKRLNFHPSTKGGAGISLYYDTGNIGGDLAPNWNYQWSWFPLKHLGGKKYFGSKRSFIKGKGEYLEKVWLQFHDNGALYIRYSLIKGITQPYIQDKLLGTKEATMYQKVK